MKIFLILFFSFYSSLVFADRNSLISRINNIPGMGGAKFVQDVSLWVMVDSPSQPHNYQSYGSMICNGGSEKHGVNKGYSITFWDPYKKKELGKYRCY